MKPSAGRMAIVMPETLPITLRAYRRLSSSLTPMVPLLMKRRLRKGKEDPERIDERRGIAAIERPAGPLVWVHGASVGEVLAAATLIERLRASNMRILLTSGTVTSAAIIAKRFPPDIIHQYIPYDSPRYVARFLDHWHPSLALFIESDLWPNLILSAAKRRLPMALINARMSQRSFPRWQKFSKTISALLGSFEICLAQSDTDAKRFSVLGARSVLVTGNLKFDVQAPPGDAAKLDALKAATRGRPIVVASSTHPGEEEIILETHKALTNFFPSLLTVIVPRHAHRGEAIAEMVQANGLRVTMRSRGEAPSADVYVADTMGELGLFYRLTPVVFMGGSLVPHGGQNPIEPAKLGAAIVHGPHVFNFTDVYDALDRAGGARQANSSEQLVKLLGQMLGDRAARDISIDAAAQVVTRLGGGLDRTLHALEPYLMQLRFEMGGHHA
ncbi:3-deoxy-D-manno-octulosonic acid transferase [Tardiphaga alba]|uniref:3-deoxy-D-manno-octulosonic acid transferase n=2 Tax=Tardiphaga alba TaxID=340268 RepID=A0ABX8AFV1_9BRAD|nr:3-deoxy-D-manno-octulosonic acid transferase [Tardiphaga alba]QUS41283.1 3-deoxy-D-manno-octulosonic acid transferase [Tardiphaga alba]